jgi:hypothetical protein
MLAYSKIWLYEELLASVLSTIAGSVPRCRYFPAPLRSRMPRTWRAIR